MAIILPDKVCHALVRTINRSEAGQDGHNSDANHSDPGDRLLNGEDALRHGHQWKRVSNAPQTIQEAKPKGHSQGTHTFIGNCAHHPNSSKFIYALIRKQNIIIYHVSYAEIKSMLIYN